MVSEATIGGDAQGERQEERGGGAARRSRSRTTGPPNPTEDHPPPKPPGALLRRPSLQLLAPVFGEDEFAQLCGVTLAHHQEPLTVRAH